MQGSVKFLPVFMFVSTISVGFNFYDLKSQKETRLNVTIEQMEEVVRNEFPGKQTFLELDMYERDMGICKVEDENGRVVAIYKFRLTPFKKKVRKRIKKEIAKISKTENFEKLTEKEREKTLDAVVGGIIEEEMREVLQIPKRPDFEQMPYEFHLARFNVVEELKKRSWIEGEIQKFEEFIIEKFKKLKRKN